MVVKDVATLPWWSRPIGRWLLRRERRCLLRLTGIEGVPQWLGDLDRNAFAMSILKGAPLDEDAFLAAPRAITDRLQALLASVHARRVYHLDARQRQNILLDGTRVLLVDFGAASAPGVFAHLLLGRTLRWVDEIAALKHLNRHAPQQMTAVERKRLARSRFWRRLWFFSPYRNRPVDRIATQSTDADREKKENASS